MTISTLEAVRTTLELLTQQRNPKSVVDVTGVLRIVECELSEAEDLRDANNAHHAQELSFWQEMADDLYRLLKEAAHKVDATSSLWPEVNYYLDKYENATNPPMTDDEIEELADKLLEQAHLAGEALHLSYGLAKPIVVRPSATVALRNELIKAIKDAKL